MSESDHPNVRSVRMDSIKVLADYRLTIPEDPRDYYGIVDGDLLTLTLLLEDDDETFQKKVDHKGRVTIPARIRNEHGIDVGDQIDVEMEVP